MEQTRLVYTVREAAELLRMHPQSVYHAIARGEIPHVRVGRRLLVPARALDEHLTARALARTGA
jgi:excisionase family DNA binding protein